MERRRGPLLLLGSEATNLPGLGERLAGLGSGPRAVVVPTAAAFTGPEAEVVRASALLGNAGFEVEGIMASSRSDAELPELAERVEGAGLVFLTDGSALHLRTTLRSTKLLGAIESAWGQGACLLAVGGAAAAICDPMADPRGGAPTVGLGLVEGLLALPRTEDSMLERSLTLFPEELLVAVLGPGSGLLLGPEGVEALGEGLELRRGGELVGLEQLSAR